MVLLKRLRAVADMIIENKSLADIGADHAQLSIYLLQQQMVPAVIIGELGDGPYRRALQAVFASGLSADITVRQGNGLAVLEKGEVSTVVLAGMGADTIIEILSHDDEKARSFQRFVFQPMSKVGVLRKYLAWQGWPVVAEQLVGENNQFFQVLASEPGNTPYRLTTLETELGFNALQADTELKRSFLKLHHDKYTKVVNELLASGQEDIGARINDYRERIKELEMILGASSG